MKVLIVDDEPLIRRSLKRALESRGHEVREAEDGLKGLAIWEEFKPELAFVDVLMPGLTGPQLIEKVRHQQTSKIVLMSAYEGLGESVKSQSIDLFIAKPFQDIFEVIQQAEKLHP